MDIKFDRAQISSINNIQLARVSKNKNLSYDHRVAVPTRETFEYILANAKKGNEMAAVQLDEWQRACEPKNEKEKQIVNLVKCAVDEILK